MSSRTTTKRLLQEIANVRRDLDSSAGIERCAPVSDGIVLAWESVINGRGIGAGYDGKDSF